MGLFPGTTSSATEAEGEAFLCNSDEGTVQDYLRDNRDPLSLLVLLKRKVFGGSHGACSTSLSRLWRCQMHLAVLIPLQDRDTNSVTKLSTGPA